MSVPFCPECGDRVVMATSPALEKLVMESGWRTGDVGYIEMDDPFVLQDGNSNTFGEPGWHICFNAVTRQWSVEVVDDNM